MGCDYAYIPLSLVAVPTDGRVLVNKWWSVHPERGAAFFWPGRPARQARDASPQCHAVESIARGLCRKLYPDNEVMFLPVVFLGHLGREPAATIAVPQRGTDADER